MPKSPDANDRLRDGGWDGVEDMLRRAKPVSPENGTAKNAKKEPTKEPERDPVPEPVTVADLVVKHTALRDTVIDGLLRTGETMNVIASSKARKSWLVLDLALSVASGTPWLGRDVTAGRVLVIDNELHPETIAHRIPQVAAARGLDLSVVGRTIDVVTLRGRLHGLYGLARWITEHAADGRYRLIIIDAWYRTLPPGTDENDNGAMSILYNCLDAAALSVGGAFVCVHHASKGSQFGKSVTDVGAGAGAMSRAVDTHLILRPHEEDGCMVMEAVVRSWPPVDPTVLRWSFPVWTVAADLDPADLAAPTRRKPKEETKEMPDPHADLNATTFVQRFIREPRSRARAEEEARQAGVPSRRVWSLLQLAMEEGLIHRADVGGRPGYALGCQPDIPFDAPAESTAEDRTKGDRIKAVLRENPGLDDDAVAEKAGASRNYVRRIRAEEGRS